MKGKSLTGHLSMLGAWALAFGCAVGSDAFVMPWTTFLPKAGPLGAMLGIVAGGLVMAIIAWNYHYMINRQPGPGGVYTYASEAFGHDHGFLSGYFLGFTYMAIVWLDITALVVVMRYLMGDVLSFGFHYNIEGSEVYLGTILFSIATIAVTAVLCFRRRLTVGVQIVMALVFALGILACFAAAASRHTGGVETLGPLFSPTGGSGLSQFLNILAFALWLFIGFESISNFSAEFRFPQRRSFKVMLVAILTSVVAYLLLTALPVLVSGGWLRALANIGDPNFHAFDVASSSFGGVGKAIVGLTLIGGIFTNLVGNTAAASRIVVAMADDGALPAWFGERNEEGFPRNAVLAISGLAILIAPLGRAAIGVIVDIAIVGAAVAYGYTSAAAFRTARREGDRRTEVTGLLGTVISVVVITLFLLPVFSLDSTEMATESYLVLISWGLSGLALFLTVFHRDKLRRFGRSSVVWISLFLMILLLSLVWMHQTTHETTKRAYDAIIHYHADHCHPEGPAARHPQNYDCEDWRAALRKNLAIVNRTIIGNSLVQGGLNILALVLMIALITILRRRERDIEREKAKAKSYFFSTVSHDIRTPLNAIIGFSELLQAGFKTEEERQQAIDSILVSGKTLLGLINDVLDLSKLESGKMEISPEPTDCSRLLHAVLAVFRVSIAKKTEVELRCQVEPMPLLMLDPQRLRQIVFNLVGNAIKFTSKGSIEVRASFDRSAGSETGVCRIDVEDTGCGISDENLKHLGSAYVQVGDKRARNGGTGLGLAICQQLILAMGGELKVSSALGKGSMFSVIIPDVKVAHGNAGANGTGGTAGTNVSAGTAATNGADGTAPQAHPIRRILLVDDSKMNLLVLKALLKKLGNFEVATAENGQEALTQLQTPGATPVDLVLTDMWMPELDGTGLVKAIRADPALASLRVIAVTADTEFQGKVEDLGFDGMLLKPVTLERLSGILGASR